MNLFATSHQSLFHTHAYARLWGTRHYDSCRCDAFLAGTSAPRTSHQLAAESGQTEVVCYLMNVGRSTVECVLIALRRRSYRRSLALRLRRRGHSLPAQELLRRAYIFVFRL